jgi:magnesium-transporting ATPase (P-type)
MRKTNLFISLQGLGMAISLMILFLLYAAWYISFIPLFITLLVGLILIIGPSMPKKQGKGASESELNKLKMQMLLIGAVDLITFALLLVLAILLLL